LITPLLPLKGQALLPFYVQQIFCISPTNNRPENMFPAPNSKI
jgi:hypothetical protein